ncbi:MAG: hypothetical protein ABSD62_07595 [Candidatus Limnocylindrales bacterium]|jgi:hypothetical protein
MGEAFVIMQIGNAELDRVYSEVIGPALTADLVDGFVAGQVR